MDYIQVDKSEANFHFTQIVPTKSSFWYPNSRKSVHVSTIKFYASILY